MTTIREAILKAADHIERNPREFNFSSTSIPSERGCGTPGCALGWIGYFGGVSGPFHEACSVIQLPVRLFDGEFQFYSRMDEVFGGTAWKRNAASCATALRLYADRFHPAAPIRYPDWQAMAAKRTVGVNEISEDARV